MTDRSGECCRKVEGGKEVSTIRSNVRDQLTGSLMQPDVISGSEMLMRSLILEEVECVFGYPGGAVLYIYDAIHSYDDQFRHMLARHEQGAVHAADGYARASGKPGVCIATSGPGATNLITGIAIAHRDNIPLVVITGNVALSSRGTDAFQEADVIGMTLPITKHSYYITDAADIPDVVQQAFRIASASPPGPVLIDIPKDISAQKKAFRYRKEQAADRAGFTGAVQAAVPGYGPEPGQGVTEQSDKGFTAEAVLRMICDTVPADGIVTADEISHYIQLTRRRWPARSLICPVGMEAPGFSLPAAIGAQLAYPERTVVTINGEGGLQKNAQELAICAIHNIALKIVVFSEADPSGTASPDFMKLAEAYGLKGLRVERLEEAREVWAQAMKEKGPVLVEFALEGSGTLQ